MIKDLAGILNASKLSGKKRLAIAAAEDDAVIIAVKNAVNEGIIEPIFVGDQGKIHEICKQQDFDISGFQIIPGDNPASSCQIAVQLVKEKKADLLMKGLVSTSPLLKAVLDKEKGIKKNAVLSHVAVFETPFYSKLLGVTDVAMNIAPSLDEKVNLIENAVFIFKKLGNEVPKIAVIGPVETVNSKIDSTGQAAMLTLMNKRGQISGCIIDGPLALDNAISKEAALHKKISSEVAGEADILLMHDLDAGNVLYKALLFLGGAKTAAVVVGAQVPVVLTSRADTDESKLYSIALATLLS